MSKSSPDLKRKKILFFKGFQIRYAALVAGSLIVLLLFSGFHAMFVANTELPLDVYEKVKPALFTSTWRLFFVGLMYVIVVTMAAVFLSHRSVGPIYRLETELKEIVSTDKKRGSLKIRQGDELEGVANSINKLLRKLPKKRKH